MLYSGPALHPPALAHLDRLPGHPGRLHARAGHRLLREQPAGDLRAAASTRSATRWNSRVTANSAGGSRPATARAGSTRKVKGVERHFFDYVARGVPVRARRRHDRPLGRGRLAAVRAGDRAADDPAFRQAEPRACSEPYGFKATFNRSFPVEGSDHGWVSPYHFGIDQGPIVLMIENYRTGLIWELMRRCPYIVTGLRRAGFRGGG